MLAPMMTTPMMTTNDLHAFFDRGWNRHDVDLLMTFMAEDCVFESTAGPEACGTRHAGRERGGEGGRGRRLRSLHLRGRQDRAQELVFQDPHRLSGHV